VTGRWMVYCVSPSLPLYVEEDWAAAVRQALHWHELTVRARA
jgi:hypothetical protein